jgi:DNA-binding PadR family transcriptional regulator
MSSPKLPMLGYALLGLLSDHPSSGYDVRKMFSTTPIGTFSDSPGAIYPALKRLEAGGLIRGEIEHRGGLRRRKVFRPTASGTRELKRWLSEPVTRDNMVRGMHELMLRFGFMDGVMGPDASAKFLSALERELNAYIRTLKEFLAVHKAVMPISGALALESGIRGYEAQVEWAKSAILAYKKRGKS